MSLRRSSGTLAVALTMLAASAAPASAKFDNSYFPTYTPPVHHGQSDPSRSTPQPQPTPFGGFR